MLERIRAGAPAWRRALRRRRRLLTMLTLAAAVAALLPGLLPPSARGVEVLVATRPLPAGTVLAPSHLRTVRIAAALVPEGALTDPGVAAGRTLRQDLAERSPVLPGHLAAPEEVIDLHGRARMVLPLDAALLPHVSVGTRLRIVLSGPEPGATRTVDAQVVDPPEAPSTPGAGPATGLAGGGTVPVVVAVDPEGAVDVAHSMSEGWVSATVLD